MHTKQPTHPPTNTLTKKVSLTNTWSTLLQQTQHSAQHTTVVSTNTTGMWNISSQSPQIVSLIFHPQWLYAYSTCDMNNVRFLRKLLLRNVTAWKLSECTNNSQVLCRPVSRGVIRTHLCLFSSLIRDRQSHILAVHPYYFICNLNHLPAWDIIRNFWKSTEQLAQQRALTDSF